MWCSHGRVYWWERERGSMNVARLRVVSILIIVVIAGSLAGCGSTPSIHSALSEGNDSAVLGMIKKHEGINERDRVGNTPLHIVSVKGNQNIARKLVEAGADVNARNFDGRTPLMLALFNGHSGLAKFYIKQGAQLKTHYKKTNALLDAAAGGSVEMADYLLAHGFDINTVDRQKTTALHIAARNGDKKMVAFLVSKGANLDAQTDTGWTAMHFAAYQNQPDTVDLLLASGAHPVEVETNGVSAFASGKIYEQAAKRAQSNHSSPEAKAAYEHAAATYEKSADLFEKYAAETSEKISDTQLKNFLLLVGGVVLAQVGPGTTLPNPSGGVTTLYTPVMIPQKATGSLEGLKAYLEEQEKEARSSYQRCKDAAASL